MLTGSAFRVTVRAPAETFVLRGKPSIYIKTADSGSKRAHAFCPNCGTPVYASTPDNQTAYSLRLGALRQRHELRPRRQIWCSSALSWSMNIEALPKLERQ